MKIVPKVVLALTAFAAIGASAQTYSSDQDRRDRNREEALSNYRASTSGSTAPRTTGDRRETTVREDAREAKEKVRDGAHKVANSTRRVAHKTANEGRRVGHKVANEGRRVGHKVAVKARETTARADARFGTVEKKDGKGEASNPTGLSSTAANGPSPKN